MNYQTFIKPLKPKTMRKSGKMTGKAAARIQSSTARSSGGKISKGSFASRAQSAAAKGTGKSG